MSLTFSLGSNIPSWQNVTKSPLIYSSFTKELEFEFELELDNDDMRGEVTLVVDTGDIVLDADSWWLLLIWLFWLLLSTFTDKLFVLSIQPVRKILLLVADLFIFKFVVGGLLIL